MLFARKILPDLEVSGCSLLQWILVELSTMRYHSEEWNTNFCRLAAPSQKLLLASGHVFLRCSKHFDKPC